MSRDPTQWNLAHGHPMPTTTFGNYPSLAAAKRAIAHVTSNDRGSWKRHGRSGGHGVMHENIEWTGHGNYWITGPDMKSNPHALTLGAWTRFGDKLHLQRPHGRYEYDPKGYVRYFNRTHTSGMPTSVWTGVTTFVAAKKHVRPHDLRYTKQMGVGEEWAKRANPATTSDDKVIDAFLAKREAASKYLRSSGQSITMIGLGSSNLAEWVDGKIKLGYPYGNVSQSYIKKVAKRAPAYLLTGDSYWALPAKTVKLLKSEGRGNPRKKNPLGGPLTITHDGPDLLIRHQGARENPHKKRPAKNPHLGRHGLAHKEHPMLGLDKEQVRATADHLRKLQQARAQGYKGSYTTDPQWLVEQAINRRGGYAEDPHYRGSAIPVKGKFAKKGGGDWERHAMQIAGAVNTPRRRVYTSELGEWGPALKKKLPKRFSRHGEDE